MLKRALRGQGVVVIGIGEMGRTHVFETFSGGVADRIGL